MSGKRRRYRAKQPTITQPFSTELNGNAGQHLEVLTALISGVVGGKRTSLPAIAASVPHGAKRETRGKRFYRWTKDERITANLYLLPSYPARARCWRA